MAENVTNDRLLKSLRAIQPQLADIKADIRGRKADMTGVSRTAWHHIAAANALGVQ